MELQTPAFLPDQKRQKSASTRAPPSSLVFLSPYPPFLSFLLSNAVSFATAQDANASWMQLKKIFSRGGGGLPVPKTTEPSALSALSRYKWANFQKPLRRDIRTEQFRRSTCPSVWVRLYTIGIIFGVGTSSSCLMFNSLLFKPLFQRCAVRLAIVPLNLPRCLRLLHAYFRKFVPLFLRNESFFVIPPLVKVAFI